MYQDIKPAILGSLRYAPLTIEEIAEEIDAAQFTVRAELKTLKRDRFVIDELGDKSITWKITDRGTKRLNADDQLRLA